MQRRIKIANHEKADLFLSFHLNSFSSSSAEGSKTFYYKYKDKKLAQHVSKQLAHDLDLKTMEFHVNVFMLRHTSMPAVLLEPLFLTNPTERMLLSSDSFRNKLAFAIYQGIKNYYLIHKND